jgi:hypothetical protein
MNRRVRNRTHGGVGGRELQNSLLPDVRPAGRTHLEVTCLLVGSPLQARQGELLAGRQGCPP